MLGATGINVGLDQINNGELGPRMLSKEYGISWLRALLDHPVGNLPALRSDRGTLPGDLARWMSLLRQA